MEELNNENFELLEQSVINNIEDFLLEENEEVLTQLNNDDDIETYSNNWDYDYDNFTYNFQQTYNKLSEISNISYTNCVLLFSINFFLAFLVGVSLAKLINRRLN